jgi:hypothetical protein
VSVERAALRWFPMLRDAETLLRNRLESLGARQRALAGEIACLQGELARERAEYECLIAHWQQRGWGSVLGWAGCAW